MSGLGSHRLWTAIVGLAVPNRPRRRDRSRSVASEPGRLKPIFRRYGRYAWTAVAAVSFWLAVALPTFYLPLLFVGLERAPVGRTFAALLVVHTCTIVLSHRYRPGPNTGTGTPANEPRE